MAEKIFQKLVYSIYSIHNIVEKTTRKMSTGLT